MDYINVAGTMRLGNREIAQVMVTNVNRIKGKIWEAEEVAMLRSANYVNNLSLTLCTRDWSTFQR
jgi:hypothetical protein